MKMDVDYIFRSIPITQIIHRVLGWLHGAWSVNSWILDSSVFLELAKQQL